ncbi:MAG: hypothetical protein HY372_00240 [Candidatus Andersenbacteria bacterium]|nr:hypothetical protein [Candidatus Andersenbacteria bacterium]
MVNDDKLKDVTGLDESRLMAALSYVGVLVLVPILVRKDDPFVRWHAQQGMVLLAGIILALLAAAWIAVVGNVLFLLLLIADIIALVQALLGRRWKIPVIGHLAEQFRI